MLDLDAGSSGANAKFRAADTPEMIIARFCVFMGSIPLLRSMVA